MLAQEHHVPVTRSARYYQLGEPGPTTQRIWLVAHGYGQLAAYFIRHFALLAEADPHTVVVAPEGLSRFYLQGTTGRVGATWMTREDRLTEIEDYTGYLDQLLARLLTQVPTTAQVTVLGFSQGAATVSRWLSRISFRPARLILWAGAFAPDIEPAAAADLLRTVPLTVVCGDADPFVTPEMWAEHLAFLRQLGAAPVVLRFAGAHTLDAVILRQLAERG